MWKLQCGSKCVNGRKNKLKKKNPASKSALALLWEYHADLNFRFEIMNGF